MISVKLRIVSRTRDRAYIDNALYVVRFKKADEFFHRAGGVPDGHDNHFNSACQARNDVPAASGLVAFPDLKQVGVVVSPGA